MSHVVRLNLKKSLRPCYHFKLHHKYTQNRVNAHRNDTHNKRAQLETVTLKCRVVCNHGLNDMAGWNWSCREWRRCTQFKFQNVKEKNKNKKRVILNSLPCFKCHKTEILNERVRGSLILNLMSHKACWSSKTGSGAQEHPWDSWHKPKRRFINL